MSRYDPLILTPYTRWCHVSCANWHQGPCFSGEVGQWAAPILRTEVKKSLFMQLQCCFCLAVPAVCLQCSYGSCTRAYCVPCGMRGGCKFQLKLDSGSDAESAWSEPQRSFCLTHRERSHLVLQANSRNGIRKPSAKQSAGKRRRSVRIDCPVCRQKTQASPSHRLLALRRCYELSKVVNAWRRQQQVSECSLAVLSPLCTRPLPPCSLSVSVAAAAE